MSVTVTVTAEIVKAAIGTLPSLAPTPNASNILHFENFLCTRLAAIRHPDHRDYGCRGMGEPTAIYALKSSTLWTSEPDPGEHRPIVSGQSQGVSADADVVWRTKSNHFLS